MDTLVMIIFIVAFVIWLIGMVLIVLTARKEEKSYWKHFVKQLKKGEK